MNYVIRRPVGRKRFLFHTHIAGNDEFRNSPFGSYIGWTDEETARAYMKDHKSSFGPDDEIVSFEGDGKVCPYCHSPGTSRVDGTERDPGKRVVFDMVCTNCNAKWMEKYTWKETGERPTQE